jgi:hypothetical protein
MCPNSVNTRKRKRQLKAFSGITPDFANLPACVEEIRKVFLSTDEGPNSLDEYGKLMNRLEASQKKLPPLYVVNTYKPFMEIMEGLGNEDYSLLYQKGGDDFFLMADIAQAILQNGEGYEEIATDGFQEVITDLYDGFLSEEDRWSVKKPDYEVIPPLVKWGPDGPYTITSEYTLQYYNIQTAIVDMPPAAARAGVMVWAALAHETAGHDILHADDGLLAEMQQAIWQALKDAGLPGGLPEYWAERIDESASDVLGILNMGPAPGIGVLALLRGVRKAMGLDGLLTRGPADDEHPADIVRCYLAASTIRLLSFDGKDAWADAIEAEADQDLTSSIILAGRVVSVEDAKKSAGIVAQTIAKGKMQTLEMRPLIEIQDWRNEDEQTVQDIIPALVSAVDLPDPYKGDFYAAHAVAAAVVAALRKDADLAVVFSRMQAVLKAMHDANPSWGPLYIMHPGDLKRKPMFRSHA